MEVVRDVIQACHQFQRGDDTGATDEEVVEPALLARNDSRYRSEEESQGTKADKSDWARIQAQAAFGCSYEEELVKETERRKEITASSSTVRHPDSRLAKADVTTYLDHLADSGTIATFPRQQGCDPDADSNRPTTSDTTNSGGKMDTSA
ncbi:MAG: hypothetical protein M1815_003323 [Lichina confinis]|nr:MAG: hypothetical protein M1815_003323 [Lichina confinis]